jgi:hypothetical protein
MLMYWLLFTVSAALALQRLRLAPGLWALLGLALTLVVGLRYDVGGDWAQYLNHYRLDSTAPLANLLALKEQAFHLLNKLAHVLQTGPWLVNLVCGALFVAGLLRFCRQQPLPLLALTVAVPYLLIVVGMGYQRQAVALGLLMWGLVDLVQRRYVAFVVAVALGALFHQTVLLVLPLAALANTRNRWWSALWVGLAGALLYRAILAENTDALWANYVTAGYASEGGPIRVAMNALPALVFLLRSERLSGDAQERALWRWVALMSLLMVPLVGFASTAVDRVALYLLPIQLLVWSRLPLLFVPRQQGAVQLAVITAYAAVQAVWLLLATHSRFWLPYQFWPLVWLAQ